MIGGGGGGGVRSFAKTTRVRPTFDRDIKSESYYTKRRNIVRSRERERETEREREREFTIETCGEHVFVGSVHVSDHYPITMFNSIRLEMLRHVFFFTVSSLLTISFLLKKTKNKTKHIHIRTEFNTN